MPDEQQAQSYRFGPMGQPAQPGGLSDQELMRLAAMIAQISNQQPAPAVPGTAVESLSEEDQRLVNALSGVHPNGRGARILYREEIANHLFFVEYSYVAAGASAVTVVQALVYDDGQRTHVWS